MKKSVVVVSIVAALVGCGEQAAEQPSTSSSSNASSSANVGPDSMTTSSSTGTTAAPIASTSGGSGVTATTSAAPSDSETDMETTSSGRTSSGPNTAPSNTTSSASATSQDEVLSSEPNEMTSSSEDTGSEADTSGGCGSAMVPESGRFDIDVNGETREYILAVPDGYDPNKPYRMVFAWHPWGGSAEQVAGSGGRGYYGLEAEANGEAIFVSPDGLDFGGNGQGWGNEDGKDLAFFDAMMERFQDELCIDRARVFSTGFSFGGMMSWALGCGRADVVRAIAPMAGNTTVSGCLDGDTPVAVMGFHGDDDTVVTIDGGRVGRDTFIERNKCGEATPSESTYCEGAGEDRQPCTCTTYEGCEEGYPVTWCEFNGPHTPAPNSAATIWNFFAQF